MKFIKISIGVAAILALISLAAYGQMGTAATDPAAKAVVDPNGDLRVPADYRTSYQFLGSWAVADGVARVQTSSMSFTRRRVPLRRIAGISASPMARCW